MREELSVCAQGDTHAMKHCRWFLTLVVLVSTLPMLAIERGQKWDQQLNSNIQYDWVNTKVCVQYTSPSGRLYTGLAFWDSRTPTGDIYRIRAAFNEVGNWQWTLISYAMTGCASTANFSMTSGTVNVTSAPGGTNIRSQGPLYVGSGGRYLIYSGNNAPFHWTGDTSWAGPHASDATSWQRFTSNRAGKGYNVIQVAAPISGTGAPTNAAGLTPFYDPSNPTACDSGTLPRANCLPRKEFWDTWDARIENINSQGMLATIIGLYKRANEKAGTNWPTLEDSRGYARMIAARVAGNYTALAPGFDEIPRYGDFTTNCTAVVHGTENQACRAREVGNAIKNAILLETPMDGIAGRIGAPLTALVTHHIGGGCPTGGDGTSSCTADVWLTNFEGEGWLDFTLVQSGQGQNRASSLTRADAIAKRASLRMLRLYNTAPAKPVINGEAIYDQFGSPEADYGELRARHAAINSLLSGATGFTHGVTGTWNWGTGSIDPSLSSASSLQIAGLKSLFATLRWDRLRPDCQVWTDVCTSIKNGNQATVEERYKRMYAYDSNSKFAIGFLPAGQPVPSLRLNMSKLPGFTPAAPWKVEWYNPADRCTCATDPAPNQQPDGTWVFGRNTNSKDWVLVIRNTTNFPTGIAACTSATSCQH